MMRGLQGITTRGVFFVATITGTIGSTAMTDDPIVKPTVQVSGTGTDLLNGALVHSKMPTATGVIQRGTEIVELSGDLNEDSLSRYYGYRQSEGHIGQYW